MLLSNLRGALRQIRQEPDRGYEYGYIGRHRAPEEADEAPTTLLPPIVPGPLQVPAPRPAPAT
ncbi:hypothetical protein [Catenuloplanes atrovinosus]|uniref:Uncharacterized protein n=1 Tax=Catenuloplanes atrovinosus TaxID=137266 RepID=A0AAE3YVS6_9ACTN|nr:hypothetical protein [Catenuloplanes atrovinosus]MDR7280132.1 hypothetical protein [Catenuloplanes atrovinosus]